MDDSALGQLHRLREGEKMGIHSNGSLPIERRHVEREFLHVNRASDVPKDT
jgi:hypothetical protein